MCRLIGSKSRNKMPHPDEHTHTYTCTHTHTTNQGPEKNMKGKKNSSNTGDEGEAKQFLA